MRRIQLSAALGMRIGIQGVNVIYVSPKTLDRSSLKSLTEEPSIAQLSILVGAQSGLDGDVLTFV